VRAEWDAAWAALKGALDIPADAPPPPLPRSAAPGPPPEAADAAPASTDVAKSTGGDGDAVNEAAASDARAVAEAHARAAAAFIPFLSAEDLAPPRMPDRAQTEAFLLELQKRALVEEYFGN
jgi:pre-mRNA-splicing factor ISY1